MFSAGTGESGVLDCFTMAQLLAVHISCSSEPGVVYLPCCRLTPAGVKQLLHAA